MSHQETVWKDYVLANKPNSDGGQIALVVSPMPLPDEKAIFASREGNDIILTGAEKSLRLQNVAAWVIKDFSQHVPLVIIDLDKDQVVPTRRS